MEFKGFIAKLTGKTVNTRRGEATAYSFKVEAENGNEIDQWFDFGFDKPPFVEGDYIAFEAEENDKGFWRYIKGSGSKPKNPPARASAKRAGSQESGKGPAKESGTAGSTASGADRQTSIVMQHSQEMAVLTVAALLAADALPTTEAKSKAGTAKRFNELVAAIDKFTVKFYHDAVTARLLDTVSDFGVIDTSPDAELPEAKTKASAGKKANGKAAAAPDESDDDDLTGQGPDDDSGDSDGGRF